MHFSMTLLGKKERDGGREGGLVTLQHKTVDRTQSIYTQGIHLQACTQATCSTHF